MRLQNNEYEITHKGSPCEGIEIPKTVLEEWRDHYRSVAIEKLSLEMRMYYNGKADVLSDLLKHFEEEEL